MEIVAESRMSIKAGVHPVKKTWERPAIRRLEGKESEAAARLFAARNRPLLHEVK
jgi:hypothetical protein